jgi:hypothetical protein
LPGCRNHIAERRARHGAHGERLRTHQDHAPRPAAVNSGAVVEFGHDAVIGQNQSATSAVAIGGDVYVHGTVTTAVAVGGDVVVDGRVNRTVVAVGGNVRLVSGWVGAQNSPGDTAVVVVGGKLTRGPGSVLTGNITNVKGGWFTDVLRIGVWNPIAQPYSPQAAVPWFVQTILFALFALVVTATMPRQIGAVAGQLRRRTFASLGWGALGSFIVIPVTIVILTITIVGLFLVIPGVFLGLPLTFLFVSTAVAVAVGGLLLRGGGQRGNLVLAALIGVGILSVLRFVPFFGALAVALGWFFGLGALVLAVAEWQRGRRLQRRAARAASVTQPPAPHAPEPPTTWPPPPTGSPATSPASSAAQSADQPPASPSPTVTWPAPPRLGNRTTLPPPASQDGPPSPAPPSPPKPPSPQSH